MPDIGLIDVDSHNFPNLCQMKLSTYYKSQGADVERFCFEHEYKTVYKSKVFDDTYTQDWTDGLIINADNVVEGGTGYDLHNVLPDEVEHVMPDYDLYGITDTAYGFLTRGCPRHCGFCIVGDKEGLRSHKVADVTEFWGGQKKIELLDPNITACPQRMELLDQLAETGAQIYFNQGLDIRLMTEEVHHRLSTMKVKEIHFAWDNPADDLREKFRQYAEWRGGHHDSHGRNGTVYVLVNYGSSMEENLDRVYFLRFYGFRPYIMVYDKPHAPHEIKRLQRWVNNPFVFYKCSRFEDYDAAIKAK